MIKKASKNFGGNVRPNPHWAEISPYGQQHRVLFRPMQNRRETQRMKENTGDSTELSVGRVKPWPICIRLLPMTFRGVEDTIPWSLDGVTGQGREGFAVQ